MASTPEGKATTNVLLGASSVSMRLMRNNNGAMQDQTGRLIRFGLGNESKKLNQEMAFGDQIGITTITITPEMVGKEIGVFSMLEVKTPKNINSSYAKALKHKDSREASQYRAIQWVREKGGLAWFASSAEDVRTIYQSFIQELKK